MNKKILLFGLVFLVCISGVTAADYTDPTHAWNFDSGWVAYAGPYTITNNSGAAIDPVIYYEGSGSGFFDETDDHANFSNEVIDNAANFTITFWVNASWNKDIDDRILDTAGGAGGEDSNLVWKDVAGGVGSIRSRLSTTDANEDECLTSDSIIYGTWHFITWRYNGTHQSIWINKTEECVSAITGSADWDEQFIVLNQYRGAGGLNVGGMHLDDLRFFHNVSLTDTDIADLYDSYSAAPEVFDTLNITSNEPFPEDIFNTANLSFNATVTSDVTFNCSLYINGVLNQSQNGIAGGANVTTSNFSIPFDSATETNFTYHINCTNNGTSENTTPGNVFVDNVDPSLVLSSNITSNTSASYENSFIVGQINVSDENLYGLNITIDGTYVIHNITDINTSSYIYNMSFSPSDYGLAPGVHYLEIYASDSHTTALIPDYDYEKDLLSKAITYNFANGWIKVRPTTTGLFSSFDTNKLTDRYNFEFERDSITKLLHGNDIEFEITSSDYLDIVSNTDYPGHLVSPSLEKWLDFDNEKNYKTLISRIDEKTVRILIKDVLEDSIVFNSIGGLNIINQNYTFYYGNLTETYTNQSLETDSTVFTLNFSRNDSYVSDINATFFYNSTEYNVTKTSSTDYIYFTSTVSSGLVIGEQDDLEFYWNWTVITSDQANITNVTNNQTQTVYKMIVGTCDGNITTQTLNFTTVNQSDENYTATSYEALFVVWNSTISLNRTYPLSNSTLENNRTFCMFPDWADLNTDYEIKFSANNFDDRTLIVEDGILNPTLVNYTVLMTSSSASTEITINVVDENDNELAGYVVEAYRYTLGTDNYTLMDTKTTNTIGACAFNLDISDEYQFIVKNSTGEIVYTEPKSELTETEYTFRVILGTIPESVLIDLQRLDYTLSVNKTSNNFTLIWNDDANLINLINLTVVKLNVTTDVTMYSATSISDSDILFHNVSGYGIYTAYAYVTATADGNVYLLDTISIDIREEADIFGNDAMLYSLFFIGTMTMVGFFISAELGILFTIFGMIIFYILGFMLVALSGLISLFVSLIIILMRSRKER